MKQPAKRTWSRPLADLVGGAIGATLARQGFGESDLILYWEDIVGERLASMSQPIKLQWQRRVGPEVGLQPATLVVRVESGFALEMQHCTDVVIARVNAHLGWRCVGRLSLKQGPLEHPPVRKRASPLDPDRFAEASKLVAEVADGALRDALARLGARILMAGSGPQRPLP